VANVLCSSVTSRTIYCIRFTTDAMMLHEVGHNLVDILQ